MIRDDELEPRNRPSFFFSLFGNIRTKKITATGACYKVALYLASLQAEAKNKNKMKFKNYLTTVALVML